MTDNEIIKALECCPLDDIGGCRKIDALSLINRQKTEIERLKDLNAVLETDNFNANMNLEHIQYEFDLLKQEKSVVIVEAIKEFAARLKDLTVYGTLREYAHANGTTYQLSDMVREDIDIIVKEMTEDKGK